MGQDGEALDLHGQHLYLVVVAESQRVMSRQETPWDVLENRDEVARGKIPARVAKPDGRQAND